MTDENTHTETREEAIARLDKEHCDNGGGLGSAIKRNKHIRNQYTNPDVYQCDACPLRVQLPPQGA